MKPRHSLLKSFGFALEGLGTAFKSGRNFRIQIFMGFSAILLGIILRIAAKEWVSLVLIIAMVLILELVNTSIEAIVDMVSPEIKPQAKLAKDISAGSVLVASIAAVAIGAFLFLPPLLNF